ncbi:energy-coupling factor transporter transmembrane component T [Paenibacillus sp. Marseille-Q4541]|uniref:energy-coupling factor transporter transmembrane component T family protein n=1 Tax=Paenibacillus sp. Marseille-Q4541 TaxID=2831522 RepID=UPI001BABF295|nr:energy-coupling factor transporter transmembrane component T [Paenibacillus sp. Marseille-Q4541]
MQLNIPYQETWLHRVNPGCKLVIFTSMFLVVILIHNLNSMMYLTMAMMLLLFGTGHPPLRLLLYASPFILVFISTSTGMMLFGKGETTWWKYGIIHITEESFLRGVHLGCRALSMAALGLLFGLTTRPVRLFYSLMQQWRLPPKYAYSFLAAMNLIPILIYEFQTLRHALMIRGAGHQRSKWNVYALLKQYAIPLLAQSIRKAQRIAVAMEAKGFQSENKRTFFYQIGYSHRDLWFAIYFIAAVSGALLLGSTFPIVVHAVDVR